MDIDGGIHFKWDGIKVFKIWFAFYEYFIHGNAREYHTLQYSFHDVSAGGGKQAVYPITTFLNSKTTWTNSWKQIFKVNEMFIVVEAICIFSGAIVET